MSVPELHKLCVDGFPLSTSRNDIMTGLKAVIQHLIDNGVKGSLWVDGSFMTQKIDPGDVDVVLQVEAAFRDTCGPEPATAMDWLSDNLKDSHRCDSYLFTFWPKGHGNYWLGEYAYAYWLRQFGYARKVGSALKGIAVVEFSGVAP